MGKKALLNKRQELFCVEYLKDLNATAAALRAGYSEKGANVTAHNLMKNPHVKHRIEQANTKRLEKVEIDGDKVLERLDNIGDFDPADVYDDEGCLKRLKDMPVHIRKCIRSVEVFEEFDTVAGRKVRIGETTKVTFWDKIKSNELLGKHKKLFTDQLEVTDTSKRAELLRKARERASKGSK